MEHPIGKRDAEQRPQGAAIRLGGADQAGKLTIELGLLGEDVADDAAALRRGGRRPRDAERGLGMCGRNRDDRQQRGREPDTRDQTPPHMSHGQLTAILFANTEP